MKHMTISDDIMIRGDWTVGKCSGGRSIRLAAGEIWMARFLTSTRHCRVCMPVPHCNLYRM